MKVSNPAEFVKNPNVTAAVATGIAKSLNLPTSWVNVTLSVVSGNGRRLEGSSAATGEVQVDYVITIPGVTPLVGAQSPANVTSALGAATPASLQSEISSAIAQSGAGTFDLEVQSISYEVISGPLAATTTTVVAPVDRDVPITPKPEEVDDLDDNTARNIGILVAVFVTLFVLTLCCLYAVFCTNLVFKKKEEEGERLQAVMPVQAGDGVQELNVVPVQGPPPERWAVPARPRPVDAQHDSGNLPGAVQDVDAPPWVA